MSSPILARKCSIPAGARPEGLALGAAWQQNQRPRKMKRRSQLSGACCSGQALYHSSRFILRPASHQPHLA